MRTRKETMDMCKKSLRLQEELDISMVAICPTEELDKLYKKFEDTVTQQENLLKVTALIKSLGLNTEED